MEYGFTKKQQQKRHESLSAVYHLRKINDATVSTTLNRFKQRRFVWGYSIFI